MAIPMSERQCREAVAAVDTYGSISEAAAQLGIPRTTLASRVHTARQRKVAKPAPKLPNLPAATDVTNVELGDDKGTLTIVRRERIIDHQTILREAGLDATQWRVSKLDFGNHEAIYKDADGNGVVVQMWRMRAVVVPVKPLDFEAQRDIFLADIKAHKPTLTKIPKAKPRKDGVLLEISLPDLHLGKLAWKPEAGENYDQKIAKAVFEDAANALVTKATNCFNVDRILFVVGNDMLHVDNLNNTTTRGTPQDVDSRWPKAFVTCRRMLVHVVESIMRPIAPVDVQIIPGNHDRERIFYLGDALECWFAHDDRVTVNNEPTTRKYYEWGTVLLGLDHGDKLRPDRLPTLMAQEVPDKWARATHREWHLGHLHKMREDRVTVGDTHAGVPVRILPSLSGTDAWHFNEGYVKGVRAAEAYIWSREAFEGMFNYRPAEKVYG